MTLVDLDKMNLREICPNPYPWENDDSAYEALEDFLCSQPVVDAKPIIHAHWETNKNFPLLKYCSVCGYEPPDNPTCDTYNNTWLTNEFKRCPVCGAYMDGER